MTEFCVTLENNTFRVPETATYGDVLKTALYQANAPVILVRANHSLRELSRKVEEDCLLEPVTLKDPAGFPAFQRSMSFLFLYAVRKVLGDDKSPRVILHFSAGSGFYFTIEGPGRPDEILVGKIRDYMKKCVEEKLPFIKHTVSTRKAREIFREQNMPDKAELFRYRRSSWVNLYRLGDMEDYFYGYMVPDTSCLAHFELYLYQEGIILQMPDREEPSFVPELNVSAPVFDAINADEKMKKKIHVESVADLNRQILTHGAEHQVLIAEARQERKIAEIANTIASRKDVKFVLIAGPSSSGKTSFCNRLATQLSTHGLVPHPLSLDNYYKNRKDCPRNPDGSYDYECLESLDLELFNSDMTRALKGEKVELPEFNFISGCREYHGNYLKLEEGDLMVIEGIHGLNEKMTAAIPKENKFRIYISALTCLNVDDHNRISTRDGRLIRRMVRDHRTRGTSAQKTIAIWPKVREGEERYIFPNQDNADVVFNSALIYELSVLKIYAEPLLFSVPEDSPEGETARSLLKFLDYFLGLPSETIPNNSILREFVGGSIYHVG